MRKRELPHLYAVSHDNRGSETNPFGYVYLSVSKTHPIDVARIGYTSTDGIFACRETPIDISALTLKRVREYLATVFPEVFKPDETAYVA